MFMHELLQKSVVQSEELETLLRAREEGEADFILIDVREKMEYDEGHILGVDLLQPTSHFSDWAPKLFEQYKEMPIIFTCRTDSRSGQVQMIFKRHGHPHVINHGGGIVTYAGAIE
jgi:rhodanese-related sulfurtransferase